MTVSEGLDPGYWQEHYREHDRGLHGGPHSTGPNAQLVSEAGGLAPGRALDAGCGRGADAIWLAQRGWHVTAVDVVAAAVERGRHLAESLGGEIAGRITWLVADLTDWEPASEHFDLVTSHYVHPAGPVAEFHRRLASAVAPGGTLLIVGHDAADPHSAAMAPVDVSFTPQRAAAMLAADRWVTEVAGTRIRTATGGDGREVVFHDAVLRARRT